MTLGYEDITQWSIIALNNGSSDSAFTFVEHQARASLNNSARSVMAAIAKQRDMQNGTIVTGGTANAQTAVTAVAYGAGPIPTGLRIRVKVGPGLTNTASGLTLAVDSAPASGVLNLRGQSPVPGEWIAGSYVDLVFDGTYWDMVTALPGVFTPDNMNHGRLVYSSTTNCLFSPFNGSQIKINGQVYNIPSSSVTLPRTGVNVNGTPGANLGANTTYWVGLYVTGGVLTPYYSTHSTDHTIDTTAGNVGTHILASSANTFIGLVQTDSASHFTAPLVRSWFNRQRQNVNVSFNFTANALSIATISAAPNFLCFADDLIEIFSSQYGVTDTGGASSYSAIGVDSVTVASSPQIQGYHAAAGASLPLPCTYVCNLSEGGHYFVMFGWVNAGNTTFVGTAWTCVG